MSKNSLCVVCNKRGKNETIGQQWFILCATHNCMIELDTIQELIDNTQLHKNELERFITACENFRDTV